MRVGEAGKLRAHVDGDAAALTVKASHDEVKRGGEGIGGQGEAPATADARDIEIVSARRAKAGEVGSLHAISSARVGVRRIELAAKNDFIIRRAFEQEGLSGSTDQGNLGTVERIANLVDLYGRGGDGRSRDERRGGRACRATGRAHCELEAQKRARQERGGRAPHDRSAN